jgi:hypothetical protein
LISVKDWTVGGDPDSVPVLQGGGVRGTGCVRLGASSGPKTSGGPRVAEGLITPDQLRRLAEEKELAKAKEALEKKRKVDDERHHLRDAFMTQEIHPDVFERVSRVVQGAAERGESEVLAVRFPSEYCTDGGRAINNFEPGWPDTLTGFAKRGYEFFVKELQPKGYKVRAQILDFPGGVPGDVGLFLRW